MRADLLALTPDALASLANRGLVKRATRELDGVPPVAEAGDGTVGVTFADGAAVTLPPGHSLDAAACTCGAPGVCRHRIGAVLAYQRDRAAEPAPAAAPPGWPGSVTDEELTARFGARTVASARRGLASGVTARVRRPATVETPAATVRFLVPGELGFVDCDARAEARDALIVLAVWAFRRADAEHPDDQEVTVELSGPAAPPATLPLTAVGELLRAGVVSADEVLAAALRREQEACDRANLRWPAAALAELVEQLNAYRSRSAHHEPVRVAELITELYARDHAGAVAPSRVLGTEEPAETPLRQVRLIALGCRVGRDQDNDTAEVFLAHPSTETVLAVRQRWPHAPGAVAARRVAGTTVAALAAGNVVSEAAVRSAGRVVRFGAGRLARTTVSPVGESWADLPPALRPPSVAAVSALLAALPPRLVRARVAAELVRVLPLAEVRQVRYLAGAQRLEAVVADAGGHTATIGLTHRPAAPGALDALAAALAAEPVAVSGALRRARGGLLIEPYAIQTRDGVVVPDLAAPDGTTPPASGPPERDPLAAAIEDALTLLAEAAHRGLSRLPASMATRATTAATTLTQVGLHRCATTTTAWATATDDPKAWLRAVTRLMTTAELH
ncbi:SWIM zinc finger family protein [Actinokineospora sp. 24-640]